MIRITLRLIFILIIVIPNQGLKADTALFEQANQLFNSKKYSEAIQIYNQLLDKNFESFELYYNLGTAYYENNQLAEAILFYEKAKKINTGNKSLQHNLKIARDNVETEIIEIPDFILFRIWRSCIGLFSPMIWLVILLIFSSITFYSFLKWRNSSDSSRGSFAAIFYAGFLLSLILFMIGLSSNRSHGMQKEGIVMRSVDLKSAPEDRSETYQQVSEGVKIKTLESLEGWYKVELLNKDIGWIKEEDIELI